MDCETCGMSYMPENSDNVREHDEWHDKIVNGFLAIRSNEDIIIWSDGDMRISVTSNSSPKEIRRQAEEVGRIARRDTPYGAEDLFGEQPAKIFLLIQEDRIIGFLSIDQRDRVWNTSWQDYESNNFDEDDFEDRSIWCVCMAWILSKYRKSGYASLMFDKAIEHLECGEDIAWYVPPLTDSGKVFMHCCCPEQFNIAR